MAPLSPGASCWAIPLVSALTWVSCSVSSRPARVSKTSLTQEWGQQGGVLLSSACCSPSRGVSEATAAPPSITGYQVSVGLHPLPRFTGMQATGHQLMLQAFVSPLPVPTRQEAP